LGDPEFWSQGHFQQNGRFQRTLKTIGLLKKAVQTVLGLNEKTRQLRRVFYLSGKRDSNPRPSAWEAQKAHTEVDFF
jgi:hypothetical protein